MFDLKSDPTVLDWGFASHLCEFSARAYSEPTLTAKNAKLLFENSPEYFVLAFAGTDSPADFAEDLEAVMVRRLWAGMVHEGFADYFDTLREGLAFAFAGGQKKPMFITGHSLGGAAAMIAALYLEYIGHTVRCVYTFGCPRVGAPDFCTNFRAAMIPHFRFVNSIDIVPTVPHFSPGFPPLCYFHPEEGAYLKDGNQMSHEEHLTLLQDIDVIGTLAARLECHKLANYQKNIDALAAKNGVNLG